MNPIKYIPVAFCAAYILVHLVGCGPTDPTKEFVPPSSTSHEQAPDLRHGCVTSLGFYPCPDGNAPWSWTADGQAWTMCTEQACPAGNECQVPGLASGPQIGVCQ